METPTEPDDLDGALDTVRAVLAGIGINADDLTTELYTDAVRRTRDTTRSVTDVDTRVGE